MTQPMEYERPLGLTLRAHMYFIVENVLPNTAAAYARMGVAALDRGDEIAAFRAQFAVEVVDSIAEELREVLDFTDREAEFYGHSLPEKLALPVDVQTLTMKQTTIQCKCEDQCHINDPGFQFVIRRGGEVIADPIISFDQGRELSLAIALAIRNKAIEDAAGGG